jgi:hypothetical protein
VNGAHGLEPTQVVGVHVKYREVTHMILSGSLGVLMAFSSHMAGLFCNRSSDRRVVSQRVGLGNRIGGPSRDSPIWGLLMGWSAALSPAGNKEARRHLMKLDSIGIDLGKTVFHLAFSR